MSRILPLILISILLFCGRAAIDSTQWELFAQNTRELSAYGDRMGRVLAASEGDPQELTNGFPLRLYNSASKSWVRDTFHFSGLSFRVGSTHEWHCNIFADVHFRPLNQNSNWIHEPYAGKEVAINPSSTHVWYIAPSNRLYRKLFATGVIMDSGIDALKVAVDTSGNAWAVKTNGDVVSYDGSAWVSRSIKANNIAVGANNVPYIVTQESATEGYVIKKFNAANGSWITIPGIAGVFVALDQQNNLYVVTNTNVVYRKKGIVSNFCPMCRPNCVGPECAYGGLCTSTQCLSCPSGTWLVASPTLKCESCPANCQSCSSTTTCATCSAGYYLTPNGTCLATCLPPLLSSSTGGVLRCRGPCADSGANQYYYPSDNTCKAKCELPLSIPGAIYQSCNYCPANCDTCSSPTQCLQCAASYFLISDGSCISSCEAPLISFTQNGVANCKGPCVDEAPNNFYYPKNQTCQDSCDLPISNPGAIYDSCNACPDDCLTCSSTTNCLKCISTSFLSPLGTCLPACEPPLISYSDEEGNLHCKAPCADEAPKVFYYPSNATCQEWCGLSLPNEGAFYESCEPCPSDCLTCSDTNTCEQCISTSFLSPLATCLSSCETPLVISSDETGNHYCKGPCADETANTFYYPSNNTCQDSCDIPLPNQAGFYDSCESCPSDCLTCSNTQSCEQCISTSYLSPLGECLPSCEPPLVSYSDGEGNLYCRGPCAEETTNTFYYPNNGTCQATCGVPIPNPGGFYDSCEPCPSDCLTCSSTTTCEQCISTSYLSPLATCLSSCDEPMVESSDEAGNLSCQGPCADETTNTFYYPGNATCQAWCGVPLPGDLYDSCDSCPENCLACSDTETCLQCTSTHFLSPFGTCYSSCEPPLISYSDEEGNLYCKAPCADETTKKFYYPHNETCQDWCGIPIPNQGEIYDSCQPCPTDCLSCFDTNTCDQCVSTSFLTTLGTCLSTCEHPMMSCLDETGSNHCKGPCEDKLHRPFYYPTNNTCQARCDLPLETPGGFYDSCDACSTNCAECSSTSTCVRCVSPNFLTPFGICSSFCPPPLVGYEASPGDWRCEGPCAGEGPNVHYYPGDDSCRPSCTVPISTCYDPTL